MRRASGRRRRSSTDVDGCAVVVGVGNIYANESLFRAGIRPRLAASRLSRARYDALVAIGARRARRGDPRRGHDVARFRGCSPVAAVYFSQSLNVYGRARTCRAISAAHRMKGLRDRSKGHRVLRELPTMTRNGASTVVVEFWRSHEIETFRHAEIHQAPRADRLIVAAISVPAFAAELKITPGDYAMAGDILVARPFGVVLTAPGALCSSSACRSPRLAGASSEAADMLVVGPAKETFVRCLGCTTPAVTKIRTTSAD